MGISSVGEVVLVAFPFSDLSQSKLRPAIVIAESGRDDWGLCQVTSRPYADQRAELLSAEDFASGGLRLTSYARPGKLFTANSSLIEMREGVLTAEASRRIGNAVISLIEDGLPKEEYDTNDDGTP